MKGPTFILKNRYIERENLRFYNFNFHIKINKIK